MGQTISGFNVGFSVGSFAGGSGFGSGFGSAGGSIPTSGLLLHLDASSSTSYPGSGTTWFDLASSPTANNASLVNSPTYSSANGGFFTFAKTSSQSATVSGTGVVPASAYTKAVWFKLTDLTSDNNLVSSDTGGHFMFFAGTNRLLSGHANVLPYDQYASTATFSAGVWYLVILTYTTAAGFALYVNGALDSTYSMIAHTGDGSTNIGRFASGNFLNGSVAQVLTYDRAISADEATAIYNATKARFGL